MAFHGHPRYTKDLAVWIEASDENARRLLRALAAFGFGTLELTVPDLTTPGHVVQLGYPPLRIDLLSSLDGLTFETCYPRRVVLESDDLTVSFLDVESLLVNKRATNRLQDRADVVALERRPS